MKKKSLLAILMAAVMCIMSACGSKFDSGAYVKACLDAQFKGEYEEYVKVTESTKEEAEKLYKDGLDNLMASYAALPLSEEMNQKLRGAYADMLKAAKYSIKESKGEGDELTVVVSVEPMKCFEKYEEDLAEIQKAFMAEWQEKAMNGEEVPSEAELMELMAGKVYEDLVERVKNTEYGEAQTIEVKVKKDSKNVYKVDEKDLTKVAEAAFQL